MGCSIMNNVKLQKIKLNKIIDENKNKSIYEILKTIQSTMGNNIDWKTIQAG